MILVAALLICVGISYLLYRWIRKQNENKPGYSESCKTALKNGMITAFPVVGCALVLHILGNAAGLQNTQVLLREAYKDIILAAFLEEFFKYLFFRRVVRKTVCEYSWYDLIAFMVIVGLGFGMLESVEYMLVSGPGQLLVRGVLAMHGGFGFLMGYYYGKAKYTGKTKYLVLSFLLPFLMHGIYDYTLTEELEAVSDVFIFIPVTIAMLAFVLLIRMIVFFRKAKNKEEFMMPLHTQQAEAVKNK